MESANLFWYLKNVNLFQGLNAADLRDVASIVNEKNCRKKELLYTPHSEPEDIYILKQGEITLYTSQDGKRFVLDVLGPDSIFGRLSPSTQTVGHFAEVTQDAYICTIPLKKFSKLIGEKPLILSNLLNILAGQVQEYQKKLGENMMTAEEKVIACLNQNEKRSNSLLSKWFLPAKITHAKIADQTGLSRETVSRIISRLKKSGKL